jgi:hypothetical protein
MIVRSVFTCLAHHFVPETVESKEGEEARRRRKKRRNDQTR